MGSHVKFESFPYYLVGGVAAALLAIQNYGFGWQPVLLSAAVLYAAFRSYRLHLDRLESGKLHAEELAALHLRTIEALALAIEAKDCTTHDHLQRVQVYALELGRKLHLDNSNLLALRAAAILHDIGKLAVPEYIITKPGKLTSEEFDKMKIHPVIGAEILERVRFPYDVAPIVRAHHERWNGTGYPDGLSGEHIPIGARILSVVDCLDALASDRQYRRALTLEQAMDVIVAESGKSYDPRIVEVLRQNYREWEQLVRSQAPQSGRLSRETPSSGAECPAAGLQASSAGARRDVLSTIASARQEAQVLHELTLDLGNPADLCRSLAVFDSRLHRLIPYDAIAVYVREDGVLVPRYVDGEDNELFAALRIPVGHGLSGWVADSGKPILNGNPAVEPGYLNEPGTSSSLRCALAVPLESPSGIAGVLTLYSLAADAFTTDHLRILLALKPKLAQIIEHALEFRHSGTEAIDPVTSLPNARALFAHLDHQLAVSRTSSTSLGVLVCGLDGLQQLGDRYGAGAAVQAITALAGALRECCRESDVVARSAPDQFVLVLPGFRKEYLPEKLLALKKAALMAAMAATGEPILDIRLGAAFWPEDGNSAESLLAEAGRRLFLARHGRAESVPSADDLAQLAARLQQPAESVPHSPLLK